MGYLKIDLGDNLEKIVQKFNDAAIREGSGTVPSELLPNLKNLIINLQIIRDNIGKPLIIYSGYRSPSKNESVGGVKESKHMLAMAADISASGTGMDPTQLFKFIDQLMADGAITKGGIGIYQEDGFVHYDVRGVRTSWRDKGDPTSIVPEAAKKSANAGRYNPPSLLPSNGNSTLSQLEKQPLRPANLNPHLENRPLEAAAPVITTPGSSAIAMREAVRNSLTRDILTNSSGPFLGYVIMVLPDIDGSNIPFHTHHGAIFSQEDEKNSTKPKMVGKYKRYIVVIPELDRHLPPIDMGDLPEDFTDFRNKQWSIIRDNYKTFTALRTDADSAVVGDIVLVNFMNPKDRSGPYFMSKIHNAPTPQGKSTYAKDVMMEQTPIIPPSMVARDYLKYLRNDIIGGERRATSCEVDQTAIKAALIYSEEDDSEQIEDDSETNPNPTPTQDTGTGSTGESTPAPTRTRRPPLPVGTTSPQSQTISAIFGSGLVSEFDKDENGKPLGAPYKNAIKAFMRGLEGDAYTEEQARNIEINSQSERFIHRHHSKVDEIIELANEYPESYIVLYSKANDYIRKPPRQSKFASFSGKRFILAEPYKPTFEVIRSILEEGGLYIYGTEYTTGLFIPPQMALLKERFPDQIFDRTKANTYDLIRKGYLSGNPNDTSFENLKIGNQHYFSPLIAGYLARNLINNGQSSFPSINEKINKAEDYYFDMGINTSTETPKGSIVSLPSRYIVENKEFGVTSDFKDITKIENYKNIIDLKFNKELKINLNLFLNFLNTSDPRENSAGYNIPNDKSSLFNEIWSDGNNASPNNFITDPKPSDDNYLHCMAYWDTSKIKELNDLNHLRSRNIGALETFYGNDNYPLADMYPEKYSGEKITNKVRYQSIRNQMPDVKYGNKFNVNNVKQIFTQQINIEKKMERQIDPFTAQRLVAGGWRYPPNKQGDFTLSEIELIIKDLRKREPLATEARKKDKEELTPIVESIFSSLNRDFIKPIEEERERAINELRSATRKKNLADDYSFEDNVYFKDWCQPCYIIDSPVLKPEAEQSPDIRNWYSNQTLLYVINGGRNRAVSEKITFGSCSKSKKPGWSYLERILFAQRLVVEDQSGRPYGWGGKGLNWLKGGPDCIGYCQSYRHMTNILMSELPAGYETPLKLGEALRSNKDLRTQIIVDGLENIGVYGWSGISFADFIDSDGVTIKDSYYKDQNIFKQHPWHYDGYKHNTALILEVYAGLGRFIPSIGKRWEDISVNTTYKVKKHPPLMPGDQFLNGEFGARLSARFVRSKISSFKDKKV